jgi:hypothetical protein
MIGYAVQNAKPIFQLLASRMARENPQVAFCIEIGRRMGDTPLDSEIVRRFAQDFREKLGHGQTFRISIATRVRSLRIPCVDQACTQSL